MRVRLYHLPLSLSEERAPCGPWINIMPVGLLALADCLQGRGHDTEVVHAGIEQRLDPGFDVIGDINPDDADLVGFSLHWQHQIGPVAEALEALNGRFPGLPVVLGGMTASAFPQELLERFSGVDYVIRGEGEKPLADLVASLAGGGDGLEGIPNLAYRRAGGIVQNPLGYVAGQAEMDELEYCRLDLLRHWEHYNGQFCRAPDGWNHAPVFYLGVGRGCSVDCAFCSGGCSGHLELAGRREPVFRSPSRVIDDIRAITSRGIRTVCVCFDPPPRSEPYYLEIFEALRAQGPKISMVFECYRPPADVFLGAFKDTFGMDNSRLSFSPTVEDERLRSRLLGVRYSNQELEKCLARCRELGIPTTLFFALVPQESRQQLESSLKWQARLARDFDCRLIHSPLEIEPASPWCRDPGSYGLKKARRGFAMFEERYRDSPTLGVSYSSEVGYDFPDVDARVIRAASALVNPQALLGRAMATCGQGLTQRQVIVGPGQMENALGLTRGWKGVPAVWFLPEEESDTGDWEFLERIAGRLGPNVRLVPFSPGSVSHARWDAENLPAFPGEGRLLVLHLRDARAAWTLVRSGRDRVSRLPRGVVLAEECRWAPLPCPALDLRMLAVSREGRLRCCLSADDLGSGPREEIVALLRNRLQAVGTERGCAACAVKDSCSRCLFCGGIQEREFCEMRRFLGAAGMQPGSWTGHVQGADWGVSIGWDE